MIIEGLYLMLVGMTFVISFLTLLVIILQLMKKLSADVQVGQQTVVNVTQDNSSLTAVITAAIHQHRQAR